MKSKSTFLSFTLLIILISAFVFSIKPQSNSTVEWPPVNNVTHPWARWWWHGSAVTKKDLTANMKELKNAGFGGVEVTAIYGTKGYEKQDISFFSLSG